QDRPPCVTWSVPTPRMEGDCDPPLRTGARARARPRYRRPEWKGIATLGARRGTPRGRRCRYRRPEWKGIATRRFGRALARELVLGTDAPNGRGLRLGEPGEGRREVGGAGT